MSEITIDQEFANLCRPLTAEEKAQLEANVRTDGCRDALKVWGNTLLDGHNRYEICTRLGILFKTEQASPNILGRQDAINWIIANQLGRRNLIPEDAAYLRGKRYEAEKLSPEEHKKQLADIAAQGSAAALVARGLAEPDPRAENRHTDQRAATRLSKEFGVAPSTVRQDAHFARAVDKIHEQIGKQEADLIRTGKAGLPKKAIIAFAKDEDMTLEKFNDLRFKHQQRRAKQQKERKKSAPKAPPLTKFKKSDNALDTTQVERMRPFMNAVIQIATSPVTAATLAGYPWPDTWRRQMQESLPEATNYLNAFVKAFAFQSSDREPSNGYGEAEARQESECA